MKNSVLSLKEKTTQLWFSYSQIARRYNNLLWLTRSILFLKILVY